MSERAALPAPVPAAPRAPAAAPPAVHRTLRTPGQPLDAGVRAAMEPRFGHSFADVRVHADGDAAHSAAQVGAQAYAVGPHVVFGAGRYAPHTPGGQHLLAHELAHVVQAGPGPAPLRPRLEVGSSTDPAEVEAERAARTVTAGGAARVAAGGGAPALRRFEEHEHKSLGDTAYGGALVNAGGDQPGTEFLLTFGDMVMLSGDYFSPEELSDFASRPGTGGNGRGTRDEIVYAMAWVNAKNPHQRDARFAAGGQWASFQAGADVVAAVQERYNRRGAANDPHFVSPVAGGAVPPGTPPASAGGNYRALHEAALEMAYDSGRAGTPLARALAREAAAQHYLSDAFSAGHLLTAITSIRAYWGGRYPLFWYNLLHKIGLDTATAMNAQSAAITNVLSVSFLYGRIMGDINAMAASLPPITLGDMVARVFHDWDNEHGVDVGGGRTVFGDNQLDNPAPSNATRGLAQAAMRAGITDVRQAYTLGAAGGTAVDRPALFAAVRSGTGATGTQYAPETMILTPASTQPAHNWHAADLETLWTLPIVAGSTTTVGQAISAGLVPGGEMRRALDDLALRFPTSSFGMNPRAAYLGGFVGPLVANPLAGVRGIIHWVPNYGLHSTDTDDISMDTAGELDTVPAGSPSRLEGMTMPARAGYVRELISGSVGDDEEAMVMRIFETAPLADRRRLYEAVEGHPWTGDWIEGWTVTDDDLWDALDSARLVRLRGMINGTPTPATAP
ncbi:eCIS core domain-containing protein [Longimicrobium terrae]|uniref:eCIS core domain-containing protein n=1 Tax=Longimicrobium terrae TaxID=1639882 RepID=A0A841GKQ1_9BACT|nr:hypothetical protein [Longimicrobium terrae]MBB6069311.1 hypothetical protein [Longimicrobium terrae]